MEINNIDLKPKSRSESWSSRIIRRFGKDKDENEVSKDDILKLKELKQKDSVEKALNQIQRLKVNVSKSDELHAKFEEARAKVKKGFSALNYHLIQLDLEYELNKAIRKHERTQSEETNKVKARLMHLGKGISGLMVNTQKLADFILPDSESQTECIATLDKKDSSSTGSQVKELFPLPTAPAVGMKSL